MYLLLFFSLSIVFVSLGMLLTKRSGSDLDRLEKFFPKEGTEEEVAQERQRKLDFNELKVLFAAFSKKFRNPKNSSKWEYKLEAANIPLRTEEFMAVRVISGIGLGLSLAILQMPILVIFVGVCLGVAVPLFYVKKRMERRLRRCTSQLPQALGTMATSMKSGYSFLQAMQVIAQEVPDPIGTEFRKTLREINLGIPLEEAFHNLMVRIPNDDMKIVANAIIIQRSTGGNLTRILDTIQETITDRVRIQEELRALTAQGKMSAWIISLLPVILGVVLNIMNPEYFSPMLSHPLGWTLLVLGAVSGFLGWFVIQKIVNIEV